MRQYETTFIVAPALPDGEIKKAVKNYKDLLQKEGCEIVHVNEIGVRQLAYPIKRHNSGVYFTIEYKAETGEVIDKLELIFRRDERILRFLSVRLDKYGIKYNEDKRAGIIDERKNKLAAERAKERAEKDAKNKARKAANKKTTRKKPAPKPKPEPTVEVPADVAKTVEVPADVAKAEPTVEVPADVAKAEPTVEVPADVAKTVEVPADVAKAEPTVEVPADVAKTVEVPADVAKATEGTVVETTDAAVDIAEEVSLDMDILGDLTDSDNKG